MKTEKMIFEVNFEALGVAKNALESEKIIKSDGGFAELISPFQRELHSKNKRLYSWLVFWKENKKGYLFCEVHIFDAQNQVRYRVTCLIYSKDFISLKSFINALNAKIGNSCKLQNIEFIAKQNQKGGV